MCVCVYVRAFVCVCVCVLIDHLYPVSTLNYTLLALSQYNTTPLHTSHYNSLHYTLLRSTRSTSSGSPQASPKPNHSRWQSSRTSCGMYIYVCMSVYVLKGAQLQSLVWYVYLYLVWLINVHIHVTNTRFTHTAHYITLHPHAPHTAMRSNACPGEAT
jgi:hypothetical protein